MQQLINKLSKEWHPTKNDNLNFEDFSLGSHKKVWWLCAKGHEWEAQIKNRYYGGNCPYCIGKRPSKENNLLVKNPKLANEWHPTKNGILLPENFCPSSSKKVWWLCKNNHEWQATINHRYNGKGCPICSNKIIIKENSLLIKNPQVSKEWHPIKNGILLAENFAPNSNKKVWWICVKGHEWQAQISKRNGGKGCPYCAGNLPSKENNLFVCCPELSKEWHPVKNGTLLPENFCPNSNKKVWWLCKKNHEWKSQISGRNIRNVGCPYCAKNISKQGIKWLDNLNIPNDDKHREVFIKINSKKYFADGYIPETKTIFEFLGDYWHGNPNIYSHQDVNTNNKKTFGQLYSKTIEKFKSLYFLGFTIIYRWESEDVDKIFDGEKL